MISDHVEVLRHMKETIKAIMPSEVAALDAAIAFMSAPAEAQPVAWRETVERLADGLYSKRHDARERGDKYDEGYFGAMLKDAEILLEAAPPSAPVGVDELVREYRPSMDAEVLHAWAKDIVGALAQQGGEA